MLARKITAILRGSATPTQIMMACLLGSILGFMPGFAQAPGLILLIVLLLTVLNANLALAALVTVGAKIVALLLTPLSFGVGRVLLDGPTQGLFQTAINMPVLALFGFEYYVTTGGLLLGAIVGVSTGIVLIKTVQAFRLKMAGLEEGSELFRKWMEKGWVKLLLFVLVGRGAKGSYSAMLEKRGGVIRPAGVAVCVLVVILMVAAQSLLSGALVTSALKQGLEQANGATVDLEDADIDLAAGRMTLTGLAMADPNALDSDLFRAATIEADISATSLLRKQLKLDRVVITNGSIGAKRTVPGKLIGRRATPAKNIETREGEKTLQDYLRDPGQYQRRLVQIRQWVEKLSGPGTSGDARQDQAADETLKERLEREVARLGYRRVAANHLIEGAPRFTVAALLAEQVQTDALGGETIDILASNLSTHPYLLAETPSIAIESSAETLRLRLELGAVRAGGGENIVDFEYRGLPVEDISKNLAGDGAPPIAGGTLDVALRGTIRTVGGVYVDLPMQVTLHNTTMAVGGRTALVDRFTIALGLRGPIDNLRIRVDDTQLADALVAAGAGVLASELRKQTDKLLGGALSGVDLDKGLSGIDLDKALSSLGKKDNDKDDAKKSKKSDGIRDAAKALTEGLFGVKKKKKEDGG